jgi:hypothetical protein
VNVYGDNFSHSWTGSPSVLKDTSIYSGPITTKSGDASPIVRTDLGPDFEITCLGQPSAGDAEFYIYELLLEVTWHSRGGYIL